MFEIISGLAKAVGYAVVIPGLFFVSLFFTARSMLIIFGYLKGPVLTTFERYGEELRPYNPLPALLFWLGLASLFAGFWISAQFSTITAFGTLGTLLLFLAYVAFYFNNLTTLYFRYPMWYFDLEERTSRSERRRIAYMWLRSSWRMRLFYNSSDQAFLQWADFIILATVKP
jgi:hypothetical protein